MRNLINLVLILVLSIGGQLLNASEKQQSEEQNAAPEQQAPPSSHGATSSAAVQSFTGCVVQEDNGYALKTESDTYPLETQKDLHQYLNKKVKITGILEHHQTATPSATSGNAATVTDVRLRIITSVIGDCNQPSK